MTLPSAPSRWQVPSSGSGDDQDVFPLLAGQGFLQKKTPAWSTRVNTSVSGLERRRALWSYPLWKFKVSYEFLRDALANSEWQRLNTFFNQHAGGYQSWFYFDPYDNAVTNQLVGVGDGATTTFQLVRTYTFGTITYTEPVRGVSGTPVVTINGVPTVAFTIGAMGIITFSTPPAAAATILWTGNFFYLCRFTKDEVDAQQLMQGLFSVSGLEFQSVKQ